MAAGTQLWRIYFRAGPHPTHWAMFRSFGPVDARFDHHLEPARIQERAILYGFTMATTCFAEVFQESRIIDRSARDPWLVGFRTSRDLVLLDLAGVWPTRAGASMAINTGPRTRTRRWARAIYQAFQEIDGLHYASSMYRSAPAIALFERAQDALPNSPTFNRSLSDPGLLEAQRNVAKDLGYQLT